MKRSELKEIIQECILEEGITDIFKREDYDEWHNALESELSEFLNSDLFFYVKKEGKNLIDHIDKTYPEYKGKVKVGDLLDIVYAGGKRSHFDKNLRKLVKKIGK